MDGCRKLCWTLSRFAITAWVGAAAIFVVTSVQEVSYDPFDSFTKAALATIRFPTYYAFAFTLIISALVFAIAAGGSVSPSRVRRRIYLLLLTAALTMMLADYWLVYVPLQQMTAAIEQARPAHFHQYHTASKWINAAGFCLWLLASLSACWPVKRVES